MKMEIFFVFCFHFCFFFFMHVLLHLFELTRLYRSGVDSQPLNETKVLSHAAAEELN